MRAGKATAALAAALTAALLAGCGNAPDGSDRPETSASGDAKPPVKLSVPPAYDGTKGWDESLPWVPGNAEPLVAVLPGAAAVALLTPDTGGFAVRTRAADSGKVLWTSAVWSPPRRLEYADDDDIPRVLGVEQDGRTFVVVSAHGTVGKDDLHDGTEVVRLAVFDAAGGQATGRKPLREIDVPVTVKADDDGWRVSADGGRVLVAHGDHGLYPRWGTTVDLVSGKVTDYGPPAELLKQCEGKTLECGWSRVVAAGPKGPLVGLGHGFGVPDAWFSDTVLPPGAARAHSFGFSESWNGDVYGVARGRFLAQWHGAEKNGTEGPTVWSVHDVGSGALLARMDCAYEEFPTVTSPGDSRDHPVVTSPSGRFLAAGPVAFDLERKRGVCLQGDGNRKTIAVGAIADDGVAYGTVDGDASHPVVARLDLRTATGDAKVLGSGVEIPRHTAVAGSGLFVTRDGNENVLVAVRPAR
ncbi:hypothetical protein EDD98_5773 [Streptomyces sp. PanSC19]|uniref:hypothetical protein n=1 Tax=Streptomyces sp. PanSC19 TaxID=1520455 RepID=UPI000F4A9D0B|nr:hypothetical protein [Streptomyces sp. PanSC19]ROQ26160.1 hypothetical protein EDD98_5773 [Streptomyces sp. PanSC19]